MKTFFADANIFLRYFLNDNPQTTKIIKKHFLAAKSREMNIAVISEIIPEIEYVLRKVYLKSRIEIGNFLLSLVRTPYLKIEQRDVWIDAVKLYCEVSVDLVDIFLFLKAKKEKAEVLSFNQDFKKLKKVKAD